MRFGERAGVGLGDAIVVTGTAGGDEINVRGMTATEQFIWFGNSGFEQPAVGAGCRIATEFASLLGMVACDLTGVRRLVINTGDGADTVSDQPYQGEVRTTLPTVVARRRERHLPVRWRRAGRCLRWPGERLSLHVRRRGSAERRPGLGQARRGHGHRRLRG